MSTKGSKPSKNGDKITKENPGKPEISLWKSVLSLEPALVVHMTAVIMVFMVLQDFLLEKACRVNLAYSDEICDALQSKKSEGFSNQEKEVQKLIGTVMVYRTVIENAFPIFLVLLIGAWSDKYGRKLPILFVVSAFFVQNLLLILCAVFKGATGAWTVAIVSSLVASLSGNQATFMMAAFSYVSDNTPVDQRTTRSSITHMSIFLGLTLGLAAGGIVSSSGLPFEKVFAIGVGLELFSFVYFLVMMKNRTQVGVTSGKTNSQMVGELFDFNHVKDAVRSVFKKREGNTRFKLGLLLLAHTCTLMPMMGEMGVSYLACRLQFNWDGAAYGQFMTYKTVLGFLSNFIAMGLLTQVLKLSDPANGIVASSSNLLTALLFAFASTPFMMYLAPLASLLAGGAMVVPRATISKIIPTSELGKVNSFIGSLESIIPLLASSIYTSVYKSYLDVLPGSFYLVSAALMVPPILIYLWFLQDQKTPLKKKN